MTTTSPAHRISWWMVYPTAGGSVRVRNNGAIGQRAWDATCSCGWDSKTGGALRSSVQREIDDHRLDVRVVEDPETPENVRTYIVGTWQRSSTAAYGRIVDGYLIEETR